MSDINDIDWKIYQKNQLHQVVRAFHVPSELLGVQYEMCSVEGCGHHCQVRWALDKNGNFMKDPEDWKHYCGKHYFERIEIWTKNRQSE